MFAETDASSEAELPYRRRKVAIRSADFGGQRAAEPRSGIVALAYTGGVVAGVKWHGF